MLCVHASSQAQRACQTACTAVQKFWECCDRPKWTVNKDIVDIKTKCALCSCICPESEQVYLMSTVTDVSYERNCCCCCLKDLTLHINTLNPDKTVKLSTFHAKDMYKAVQQDILKRQ